MSESDWEELTNHPDGMTDSRGANPYPNATFMHKEFRYWIRRNIEKRDADLVYNEALAEMVSNGRISCYGIQIFQKPGNEYRSLGNNFPLELAELNFGITYNILFELGDPRCEVRTNNPDFSVLPPAATLEAIPSIFYGSSDRDSECEAKTFAALGFSMKKEIAKLLRERLPEDMAAYLKKMASFQAIYHDEAAKDMDGSEAWLLLNLPLEPAQSSAGIENYDYKDSDVPMGNRFRSFLEDNCSNSETADSFAVYMIPQPGIVAADSYSGGMFTTPWKLVLWFSVNMIGYTTLVWGAPNYFINDPFHMYPQSFIYLDPEIIAKGATKKKH